MNSGLRRLQYSMLFVEAALNHFGSTVERSSAFHLGAGFSARILCTSASRSLGTSRYGMATRRNRQSTMASSRKSVMLGRIRIAISARLAPMRLWSGMKSGSKGSQGLIFPQQPLRTMGMQASPYAACMRLAQTPGQSEETA